VGDGPYSEKILPELSKYDNFKWLGPLKYPNEVRKFLSEIDVYSLLTGIDMSPLTLQEAQLMEKPVIATNVGGVPELLQNEKTGFLVEPNETSKLEESLTLLLEDEKKRKEMGKKGREFIKKKFSWEIITKQFSEVMKNNI
jgi:glycosyltransferase involved in cell wall biosynthesis